MAEETENQNPGTPGSPDPAATDAAAPHPITINADILGDFKDDPVFKSFTDKPIGEVFKSFKNAQSMIGGEKIPIPAGKLDNEETWSFVFDKLGRPKNADGYKFERPTLPDGLPYDENLEKTFKAECHKAGILPKQAMALYNLWNKVQIDTYNAAESRQKTIAEETETALIKELGTKEKYDDYVKGAHAALKRFGGDPVSVDAFIDKFGNDPLAVKVFGNVAKGMMEDAALRGDKSFNLMGEDAGAKVKDIMTNKDNKLYKAYWDNKHPQHQTAVEEVYRLQTEVHGNKAINAT